MPQLNGQLFIDLNGNGSIDAGDIGTGLSGWTVFVDVDGSGSLTAGDIFDLTDSSGNYSITGISIGTYNIGVLDNSGSTFLTTFPGAANDYYLSLPLGSVTFTRGVVEKIINFETSLSHSLSDNLSITATRQPWLNEGFQFWTDNNNNNRLDSRESSTATLFLERTNNSNATDSGFGFVNDVASGPFGAGRRLIYDRAQTTPEAGELGTFFLRGGGLYTSTAIPTFLMEYTSPAISGSGTIWDIDTTWNEFTQNMGEQWKVEFLSASVDSNGQLANIIVRDTLISPKGQPVWIPVTGVATYEANVAAADRPLALVAHNANWFYNPNSLDAKDWQWSFDRPQADINFVRFSFIGQKTLNSDVGFAFDQFRTYAEDIETKNIGVFQLATIGDQVWVDSDGDGTQNEVNAGVDGVTVNLWSVGADGVMGGGDDSLVTTTVTSNGGLYEFQVAPGSYYVEFFAPDGFEGFTSANQGGNVALDSDVSESGLSQVVTVSSGGINLDIDAGLLTPRNEPIEPAKVGDYVWLDVNKDGKQGTIDKEPGIPLFSVRLLDAADNSEVDITQTNLLGNYLFETQAGTYVIEFKNEFDDASAFTFTNPNVGSNDGTDSDAVPLPTDPLTGQTAPITLSEGEENLTFDAGLVLGNGYGGYTIGGYGPRNPNGAGRIASTGQGWTHATNYETVFGVTLSADLKNSANRALNSFGDGNPNVITFGEALLVSGNNLGANLLRQSTAALLNSYNDLIIGTGVNYPLSSAEVLNLTQLAFASGNQGIRNNIATLFDVFNKGLG